MPGDPNNWELVKAIVGEALELDEPERAALARERCGGNLAALDEAMSLIEAARSTPGVLMPSTDAWLGLGNAGGPAPRLSPGQMIGSYQVLDVVSESAASIIYRARQAAPERIVAIKLLRDPRAASGDLDRFVREAIALGRIDHPHVAKIFEAGVHTTAADVRTPYIAMEFVEGEPITHHVRRRQMPRDEVLMLLIRVAHGVHAAHQRAVIHRDLKPGNVLVTADDQPKILDFGIARLIEEPESDRATLAGMLLGTPGYMSPEQAEGNVDQIDVRTDVWALGVMGVELLTGRLPIELTGAVALEAIRRTANGDVISPRALDPTIGRDLELVLLTALRRDRELRYSGALAFAEDLENVLAERPIRARPPSWGYLISKFVVRRRWESLGLAGAAVLLIAGAVSQTLAWRRAGIERDRAIAVNELLRGMVSAADPNFGNRSMTLVDAIGGLENRLEATPELTPLVEADVRSSLAGMLFSAGEYERARAHVARSIELRESEGDRAGLATDIPLLANTLRWLYRPEEALGVAERGVKIADAMNDPSASVFTREVYAGSLHDVRRLAEAEQAYRDVVGSAEKLLGPSHERTLFAKGGLASVLTDLGRLPEAEAILREVLAVRATQGPVAMRESLTLRGNLAMLLAEQGKMVEAIAEFRDVAQRSTEILGQSHDVTISILTNLAENLRRHAQVEESIAIGRDVLARCIRSWGWSHERTLSVAEGLIATDIRLRRFDKALELASDGVNGAALGAMNGRPLHLSLKALRAAALSGLGRFDEAQPTYLEAIASLRNSLGENAVQTLVVMNNYATSLIEAGKPADATPILEDILSRLPASGAPPSMAPVIRRNLGKSLLSEGRVADGVAALDASYRESIDRQEYENAQQCATILADHFAASGDAALSQTWREKLSAAQQSAPPAGNRAE